MTVAMVHRPKQRSPREEAAGPGPLGVALREWGRSAPGCLSVQHERAARPTRRYRHTAVTVPNTRQKQPKTRTNPGKKKLQNARHTEHVQHRGRLGTNTAA